MTLGERVGRKESIEGRIYGEKIDWRMRREGLLKTSGFLSSEQQRNIRSGNIHEFP